MTGDFIVVSRFDPMLIEASGDFVVVRPALGSLRFAAPKSGPIGSRLLLGKAPFGALSRRP